MLAIATTDSWVLGITLRVYDGGSIEGTETFTHDSTKANVQECMEDFVIWADAAGRAWSTGGSILTWTWLRDTTTAGAKIELAGVIGRIEITAVSGQATTRLGIGVAAAATTITASAAASGTWAPLQTDGDRPSLSVRRDVVYSTDEGDASGAGAIRPPIPGLAGRAPQITGLGSALDAARLTSIQHDAANPRRGWAYEVHGAAWTSFALGKISRSQRGALHFQFNVEAGGDQL